MADMAASGVQPNLQTFNNVLYLLSRGLRFKETPNWMMQVINEMKRCFIGKKSASQNNNICLFITGNSHRKHVQIVNNCVL